MAPPPNPSRPRWPKLLLACALAGAAGGPAAATPPDTVRVWVELGEPEAAASAPADRRRRAQAIDRQQLDTVRALQDLGATEIVRTRHVANAIAVRIAPHRLEAVRALPGVLRVRTAEPLHPPGLNAAGGGTGAKTR